MEFLVIAIDLILFSGLLISPLLLFRIINRTTITYKFITYLGSGIVVTSLVLLLFAWWTHTSNLILLEHYGHNREGMSEAERYEKVLPANMDKVRSLETSIMGIGWPLKAILTIIIYLPYLSIVYSLAYLIGRKPKNIN